jgi:hypothetical protein
LRSVTALARMAAWPSPASPKKTAESDPMITSAQYMFFIARPRNAMADIVAGLGDDLAHRKLPLPSSNSPYAILTHCLGAVAYWSGEVACGRPAHRDRDAEFTAAGPVEPLLDKVRATAAQLAADVPNTDPRALPNAPVPLSFPGLDTPTDLGALLHLYTDLVQHHGQMQITRDALVADLGTRND